jgi:hypothetical protein
VAWHVGARIIRQALASTLGTHQTRRRNDVQVITIVEFQATRVANAEYDLTVVSLARKDAHATSLPEHNHNPILAGQQVPRIGGRPQGSPPY